MSIMMDWAADVVGRMHYAGIKNKELAMEAGYNAAYLSTVLNGKKGDDNTKTKIIEALERLEKAKLINHRTPTVQIQPQNQVNTTGDNYSVEAIAAFIQLFARLDSDDRMQVEGFMKGLLANKKYAEN